MSAIMKSPPNNMYFCFLFIIYIPHPSRLLSLAPPGLRFLLRQVGVDLPAEPFGKGDPFPLVIMGIYATVPLLCPREKK